MSDWYIEPASGGAQTFADVPEQFADGDLRVDRWTVTLTAPRFTTIIAGPADEA